MITKPITAGLLAGLLATAAVRADDLAVNQVGYLPGAAKWAALPADAGDEFRLVRAGSGEVVLRGRPGAARAWAPAGRSVRLADFSALAEPGDYELQVDGLPAAQRIHIAADAYAALAAAGLKAFYFNRAGIALEARHAGPWARPAGHPDTEVRVHASAASPGRPEGTRVAAPKGWYDAGDYNKYVVNSGITVYTLLAAWEQFPALFRAQRLNIPESAENGQGLPDVLDEALWNLEWMLAMQDPADGGVHHKLTNTRFDGHVMPHEARGERVLAAKSTAAALDFAAVMAQASRVFAPFEAQRPGLPARMRAAAVAAWRWARSHPPAPYRNPPDIHTGEYGDAQLDDELAWAAAELYLATGDAAYRDALALERLPIRVPGWSDVAGLAWMSLAQHRERLPQADAELVTRRVGAFGDELAAAWRTSPYRLAMGDADFGWGSNAHALNQALMLIQAYRLGRDRAQLDAAQSALDYVLGRNPLGRSYVTGFGRRPPLHPHHRPSEADGVAAPVPGFLVGGPNPGRQDQQHCPVRYASALPALAYLDHGCSYASNEVAINWNAPLVYVAAALQALTPDATQPACGPDALGTSRTLTLPREAAAWGTAQHAALPLAPKEVVLTFDDGPRPESTPLVLQALAAQCVRASFFMNGEPLRQHAVLARRVRDAGHSVGMHGNRHDNFPQLPPAAQLADLDAMTAAYQAAFGAEPPAYRFPFLAETPTLTQALRERGITVMSIDAGAEDWLPAQTPQMLADKLLGQLAKRGGGIVLLHDAQDQTARALPFLLQALKREGYRVVHLRWG